jgi:hypothetical protein
MPQPASMAGDIPRTLSTNWRRRGKRVVLLVRASPSTRRRGSDRLLTLPYKPGGPRSRHSSASFLFDGRRNRPNIIDQSVEFTDAKNIAPAHQSAGKERFFTTEDFATGFVGITSVNSNRGLLGSESVLPSSRDAADGLVHAITRRIGRCASGILLETKAYKNIPAELLGEGDLYASHSTVLVALAHTR